LACDRDLKALAGAMQGRPPQDAEWDGVLDLANRSLITPRLAIALADHPLPPDVDVFLQDVLARNRHRNQRLRAQLDSAALQLNRRGVTPVLLKGSAALLSADAARRDGRMLCDLDILVRPEQIDDAILALQAGGYALVSRRHGGDLHAVAELMREGEHAMIDLHQRAPGPPGMAEVSDLRARCSTEVIGDGAAALLPSPTLQLFFLVLHDQFHDGDYWSGRLNLRHLLDTADLLGAAGGVDWAYLDSLVETPVVRNALDTLLIDARWLTGATLPAHRLRRLWPRLQHWRRLTQVSRPGWMIPFALATGLCEGANLAGHGRANQAGRRRVLGRDGAAGGAGSRLSRMRDIFGVPGAGKL
jgi:hypothetical protein